MQFVFTLMISYKALNIVIACTIKRRHLTFFQNELKIAKKLFLKMQLVFPLVISHKALNLVIAFNTFQIK